MAAALRRLDIRLDPDPSRTVIRPFEFGYPRAFAQGVEPRAQAVVARVLALSPAARDCLLTSLLTPMIERHRNAETLFLHRFEEIRGQVCEQPADREQQLLIGAFFSEEFAFESAALFNPSIVRHDERPGTPPGAVGFVLSLRGIGEGHVSSVTFRTGCWHADGAVFVDPASAQGVPPQIDRETAGVVQLACSGSDDLSETVIFPTLPSQQRGIEDVRLVRFTGPGGDLRVIGTYTAFNGSEARAELLEAGDFRGFSMHVLSGRMAEYKGLALFPRMIDGRYAMLGRADSENIWLLTSDDLYRWDDGRIIMRPEHPWEFVQIGNCGSPIEIDEGWLVLTHGVGMVRSYCIGACLLDRDDPGIVLARTPEPLIHPDAEEHGGYVPNVVYSCGALLDGRRLLIPYGVGDRYTMFATTTVDDVLRAMV